MFNLLKTKVYSNHLCWDNCCINWNWVLDF